MRVAGFGYRSGATVDSLLSAWVRMGAAGVDRLATAEDKAGPLARAFAATVALPLIQVPAAVIAVQPVALSPRGPTRYGRRGLAEAAAIAAAGPGARLLSTRVVSEDGMATMAVAEGS